MASYDDVCLWKRERLVKFLRERGLPTTGRIEELRALIFGAKQFGIPLKPTAEEEEKERAGHYRSLLTVKGRVLPDPLSVLKEGWVGEEKGMSLWPPCMYGDISSYLVDKNERELRARLLTDYKEGKAFSYFDSGWLKEVLFHQISADSPYCFLKAECTPSMNVRQAPHKVWVCINKKSGQIASAYCSCFAGLGATCNHIAAILFKLDFAWQNGYTNKSCTSLPAEWTVPSKVPLEPKRIKEMEWRNPHYSKKPGKSTINPRARQLFTPVKQNVQAPTLEKLMDSLYVSCKDSTAFQYALPETQRSYSVEDTVNVESEVEVKTSLEIPPSMKQLSFNDLCPKNLPSFSETQMSAIQKATVDQRDNPLWFEQRTGRITGSNAHDVLTKWRKLQKQGDAGNMNNIVDKIMGRTFVNPNIPALKYGREMESVALLRYIDVLKKNGHKNVKVEKCGLFVHAKHIYMAASPDAVVECSCCGRGLLEIKCPLQISDKDPTSSPPDYLTRDDKDTLGLKQNHRYFTQVTMQLYVSCFKWCDFYVFTQHGHHLERIYHDSTVHLMEELQQAAREVFFTYVVPELKRTTVVCLPESPQPSTSTDVFQAEQLILGGDDLLDSGIPSTSTDVSQLYQPIPDFLAPGDLNVPLSQGPCGSSNILQLDQTLSSTDPRESKDVSVSAESKPDLPQVGLPLAGQNSPVRKKRRRCRKGKAKRAAELPIYLCGLCHQRCKEEEDIIFPDEYSIGCDKCFSWYHWGCVGYDGRNVDTWLCPACSSNKA